MERVTNVLLFEHLHILGLRRVEGQPGLFQDLTSGHVISAYSFRGFAKLWKDDSQVLGDIVLQRCAYAVEPFEPSFALYTVAFFVDHELLGSQPFTDFACSVDRAPSGELARPLYIRERSVLELRVCDAEGANVKIQAPLISGYIKQPSKKTREPE